ncbi:MAG: short-chain fatty acid transporter [Spirochaetales bacterium]|uniref:Short-chain fatty acid transporter n=1 Tax=Candidatus Thalassospirochaeta sargassi TaxID=3119039 RepID=A0AAJ1IHM9_9SPIO|nr:short-chain fatty acid transporter [Spirochaetales bacterium]
MIRVLGRAFSNIARRWLPDAFLFALILCFLVFALGMIVEGESFMAMTTYFGGGVWAFLAFSMQMALIIVTGSAMATSKPVHSLLKTIAKAAKTPTQAIMLVAFVAAICCWINWGFGLIIGALLAKELARTVRGIHYPLLVAAAYSGFLVWHAGLSASIPLKIAGADSIMEKFADGAIIPASDTIFSVANIILVALLVITLPIINRLMHPKKEEVFEVDANLFSEDDVDEPVKDKKEMTPAEKLENNMIISLIIGVIGVVYIVSYFVKGGGISLNIVNFIFLIVGILLHKTPIKYVRAVTEAVKGCGGVILQFPFYAGIMGMMISSGLAGTFSQGFVNISNQTTFPFFAFLSAGIVNFFVPSGGGQWGVQGPIMIPAAKALGVSYATTSMAVAWGDAWTNMIQPFWALPLLGVAKLNIRDIMGYTTVILLYSGIIISLFMLFVF